MKGADVFLGLSAKDVVTKDMIKSMAKNPIIFACANPDPEIKPELIDEVRSDAIVATGRSDYPNQVNLSLIHISEPTRQAEISSAVFCLKKKNKNKPFFCYLLLAIFFSFHSFFPFLVSSFNSKSSF